MKIKNLFGVIAILSVVAVSLFVLYTLSIMECIRECSDIQELCSAAQEAYLRKRFDLAYEQQPAIVAIWEGTNYTALLEHKNNANKTLSVEERAERLILAARISVLFQELGDREKAEQYANVALTWYRSITNDQVITGDDVVKCAILHDRLRRKH